ncbi:CCA tRNA nucleotidyltransferase [Lachnospiraceae bacterium 62-35]
MKQEEAGKAFRETDEKAEKGNNKIADKTILIPPAVDRIIKRLGEHGFEAYAVGGCVRDTLLGRFPEDWDITTSAHPREVKGIFPRTIDTGIQHGTVTVMDNHTGYEITTYRIDGEYEDGRHPKSVAYTASLTEDLKRRDFTINAMAYSHERGIVDEFRGMEDLKNRIIRCVGNPIDRFTEDALRILRAIRFSAQLGFEIEENTVQAIRIIAPNMAKVSKERIQTELTKLLLSDHPEKISLVFERGIAPYISSRFYQVDEDRKMAGQRGWFILAEAEKRLLKKKTEKLEHEKALRWAAFLRFSGPEGAAEVLRSLKMDNDTIGRVKVLVQWCYLPIEAEHTGVRQAMSRIKEAFDDLLYLKRFVILADLEEGSEKEKAEACLADLDAIEKIKEEIKKAGDCLCLRDLAVTGGDLIEAGLKPGKEIGEMLQRLLEDVLKFPEHNTKKYLMDLAFRRGM